MDGSCGLIFGFCLLWVVWCFAIFYVVFVICVVDAVWLFCIFMVLVCFVLFVCLYFGFVCDLVAFRLCWWFPVFVDLSILVVVLGWVLIDLVFAC